MTVRPATSQACRHQHNAKRGRHDETRDDARPGPDPGRAGDCMQRTARRAQDGRRWYERDELLRGCIRVSRHPRDLRHLSCDSSGRTAPDRCRRNADSRQARRDDVACPYWSRRRHRAVGQRDHVVSSRAARAWRLPAAERLLGRPTVVALVCAAILVVAGTLLSPEPATALPLPSPADLLPGGVNLPSLDPTHWVVDGFKAILQFIFGDKLDDLGRHLVNLLLSVPLLTDAGQFPRLNE